MTKKKVNLAKLPKADVNLTQGLVAWLFSCLIVGTGFLAGMKLFPLGIYAVVACTVTLFLLLRRKSVAPGYASVVISMLFVGIGLIAAHLVG